MKTDMAGAPRCSRRVAAARLGPPVNVVGYLPLTENMPGGDATRLGDVLSIRNGKTIEVLNTDAEGRLILADALARRRARARRHRRPRHAHRRLRGGPRRPDRRADGQRRRPARPGAGGGRAAGERAGRCRCDRLRERLDSEVADLTNIGAARTAARSPPGSSSQEFVGEHPVGPPRHRRPGVVPRDDDVEPPKGGTGFGVRPILELLADWRKGLQRADAEIFGVPEVGWEPPACQFRLFSAASPPDGGGGVGREVTEAASRSAVAGPESGLTSESRVEAPAVELVLDRLEVVVELGEVEGEAAGPLTQHRGGGGAQVGLEPVAVRVLQFGRQPLDLRVGQGREPAPHRQPGAPGERRRAEWQQRARLRTNGEWRPPLLPRPRADAVWASGSS